MLSSKYRLLLVLVLFLASVLRFSSITFDSLWLDEGYQSLVGAYGKGSPDFLTWRQRPYLFKFEQPAGIDEMLKNFRKVDPLCPPLYAVLLNRWVSFWGDCDLAVRSLSAVISIISVFCLFCVAATLFGVETGLLAACLQAISPFDVHYAQEARMYSLVVLCSILSCGSIAQLLKPKREIIHGGNIKDNRDSNPSLPPIYRSLLLMALYVISAWALINAHYTGLFIVAFQVAVCALMILARRQWRLSAVLTLAFFLLLICCLPWLPFFLQSADARKESFYVAREASFWWPVYALLIRLPVNWDIFLSGPRVGVYALPVYATAALAIACGVRATIAAALTDAAASRFWHTSIAKPPKRHAARTAGFEGTLPDRNCNDYKDKSVTATLQPVSSALGHMSEAGKTDSRFATVFVWMWALLPPTAIWLLDVMEGRKVVEIARYTIGCAPAIYIIAATGLLYAARRLKYGWLLLALHAFFALANWHYLHSVHQREPWREMAGAVESRHRPNDTLFVSEYYNIACLNRYLSKPVIQCGLSPAMGEAQIASLLSDKSRFILVTAQQGEFITRLIPQRFRVTEQIDMRHGLHLRVYQSSLPQ